MKKLSVLSAFTGMLLVSSVLADQVATVGGYGPYQTGQGGEFTLKVIDNANMPDLVTSLNYYGADTKNKVQSGTFQTFCVEGTEYIYPDTTYNVSSPLSSKTQFGNKELTAGAAYLYFDFAKELFTGAATYNYGANRATSADLLQRAIWYYMGQENQTFSAANPYMALAASTFANPFAYNKDLATPISVSVLSLWAGTVGDPNVARQDQLILSGNQGYSVVPDGGLTIALLGMALTGMAAFGRRTANKRAQ